MNLHSFGTQVVPGDTSTQYGLQIVHRGLAVASSRFALTGTQLDRIFNPNPTAIINTFGLSDQRSAAGEFDPLGFLRNARTMANRVEADPTLVATQGIAEELEQFAGFWLGFAIVLDPSWLEFALRTSDEVLLSDSPLLKNALAGDWDERELAHYNIQLNDFFQVLTCNVDALQQHVYGEPKRASYERISEKFWQYARGIKQDKVSLRNTTLDGVHGSSSNNCSCPRGFGALRLVERRRLCLLRRISST